MKKWGLHFDIPKLDDEIAELEQKAAEPDFWNDLENSQKVLQRLKTVKAKVDGYNGLVTDLDDLKTLNQLGIEEEDASIIDEVSSGIQALKDKLNKLKLETLLTGQYDKNNAILTLHAGAGGTEAQDWVQMLLRMYTRWAEEKGYEVNT